jgi:hypothetical protein
MTRHIGNVARLFLSQTQPGLFAEFGFNQHSRIPVVVERFWPSSHPPRQ